MNILLKPIAKRNLTFALAGCSQIARNHLDVIAKPSGQCALLDRRGVDQQAVGQPARTEQD